jgi:hypothetical protein
VPSPSAIAVTGTESSRLRASFRGAGGAGGALEAATAGLVGAFVPGAGAMLALGGACEVAGAECAAAQPTSHRHEALRDPQRE